MGPEAAGCDRGMHVCSKCLGSHPYAQCPQKPGLGAEEDASAVPRTTERVGNHIQRFFSLEVFCGAAGITAALKRIGLKASFGIDSTLYAVRKGPVIRLDLSTESAQHLLFRVLQSSRLLIVWIAPPCGTASRARELPLPNCKYQPPVLRTDEFPDRLTNLAPHLLQRLAKANAMYDLAAAVCVLCAQNNVAWITENPVDSLFWRTFMLWGQVHQQCVLPCMSIIMRACMGLNARSQLCWHAKGFLKSAGFASSARASTNTSHGVWNLSPKSLPQSSFRFPRHGQSQAAPTDLKGPQMIGPHFLPENTRVLSMQPDTEGVEVALPANKCSFGIPWTPEEFIKEAAARGHPNSLSLAIPPELKSAIWNLATSSPEQIAQFRAAFFKKWMNKASDLHEQEIALKESMDPELKKIVANKKILIFEGVIAEYGISDKDAPKILSEGVDMAGRIPASDDLPKQFFPATIPEEELDALGPVLTTRLPYHEQRPQEN